MLVEYTINHFFLNYDLTVRCWRSFGGPNGFESACWTLLSAYLFISAEGEPACSGPQIGTDLAGEPGLVGQFCPQLARSGLDSVPSTCAVSNVDNHFLLRGFNSGCGIIWIGRGTTACTDNVGVTGEDYAPSTLRAPYAPAALPYGWVLALRDDDDGANGLRVFEFEYLAPSPSIYAPMLKLPSAAGGASISTLPIGGFGAVLTIDLDDPDSTIAITDAVRRAASHPLPPNPQPPSSANAGWNERAWE